MHILILLHAVHAVDASAFIVMRRRSELGRRQGQDFAQGSGRRPRTSCPIRSWKHKFYTGRLKFFVRRDASTGAR
jgi:hypothetical protein